MLCRFAGDASLAPVGLDSSNAGVGVLVTEAFGEPELLSAVVRVRCAPSEFDARDERVVVGEVLADERLESGEGVERVQVDRA